MYLDLQALLLTPAPISESGSLTLDASSAQFAASAVCSMGGQLSPALEVSEDRIKTSGSTIDCG
jgi:hypothetical protein